jgi:uncharacterized membrane protein
MTEEKPESKSTSRIDLSSKFWRTLLVVLAALLTFAGPTYVAYVLINILEIDYLISMVSGLVLFIIGLVLIRYLIKNQVIT